MKAKATTDGIIVTVYVRPSAKCDTIKMTDGIEIHTREPPEGNRANIVVIKMLSKAMKVPRNRISIIRGAASRVKEVYISGIGTNRLKQLMQNGDRQ